MAVEDSLDIFGSDPFGRDYLYGLSTGRDGQGLAPYGTRYAENLSQPTTAKGRGYLGNVGTMQDPMTELSASSEIGGRTVQYPLIVPTLTAQELMLLHSGGKPTPEIYDKAQSWAVSRLQQGQDPFANPVGLRYPQPQPVDTRPYDQMQATPRGFTSGLFSDVLGRTLNMPSIPRTGIPALDLLYANRNPLFNAMGVGDVQKTAERISYGQPLTTGSGMTLKPREEAIFAGMAVAPLVGEAANLGARAGRAGARMVGERMAENVAMGRPNLPSMFAEPRSSLFAVEPSALMPKPQAPVSELGFYSAAEQAALNLPRNKGTGQSFLNDLMKAPDVKKDELSWIGLDDFLKDKPNVTKQEVQDFIASNKIDLQEVRLSGDPNKTRPFVQWSPSDQNYLVYGDDEVPIATFNTSIDAQKFVDQNYGKPTKYDKYQLAGGKNYREILLKLPEQNVTEKTWQVLKPDGTTTTGFFTTEEAAIRDAGYIGGTVREAPPINYVTGYRSSHWGGDTNVLAHMRVNDRVDADGKKMLLVEELQSDWHQAGRERGYKNPEADKALEIESKAIANERKNLVAELSEQEAKNGFVSTEGQLRWDKFKEKEDAYKQKSKDFSNQVPDAPFKDTWYQLSLKRILKYAADNGYERVGLTTGKRQVERFSDELRQNVDQIDFSSGYPNKETTTITATKNGQSTFEGNVVDGKFIDGSARGKTIDEVLGKSIAQKIQSHDPSQGLGTIKGDDLTIGGEGMKKYYDEIYPKFLEKYGKKWDAGVGETKLNVKRDPALKDMTSRPVGIVKSDYGWSLKLKDGSNYGAFSTEESALKKLPEFQKRFDGNGEPIRYIDITPKMKEGVKKGQPLAAAEQTPEMLASGGLDYADPFKNPLLESTIG